MPMTTLINITEKTKSDDAVILVEEQLDFSKYVPEGFGTGDVSSFRTEY